MIHSLFYINFLYIFFTNLSSLRKDFEVHIMSFFKSVIWRQTQLWPFLSCTYVGMCLKSNCKWNPLWDKYVHSESKYIQILHHQNAKCMHLHWSCNLAVRPAHTWVKNREIRATLRSPFICIPLYKPLLFKTKKKSFS